MPKRNDGLTPKRYWSKHPCPLHPEAGGLRAKSDGMCVQCHRDQLKRTNERLKQQIFQHYGPDCRDCGEDDPVVLSLEHIDCNGATHRRTLAGRESGIGPGGHNVYRALRRAGYPPGYAILCRNCNWRRWRQG